MQMQGMYMKTDWNLQMVNRREFVRFGGCRSVLMQCRILLQK